MERSLNIVRFLKAANAKVLTLMAPRPNPDQPLEEEGDIIPVATAYGEIARRTLELNILPCLHPDTASLVNDARSLDRFLGHSDPAAMKLCVDAGVLAMAQLPPAKFVREHRKRIGSVHLRDLKPGAGRRRKEPRFQTVELGRGTLDLPAFVNALLSAEFTGWTTVELERTGRSLAQQAAASYEYAAHTLDLVL